MIKTSALDSINSFSLKITGYYNSFLNFLIITSWMFRMFLILCLLSLATPQNNTCYANCKQGYCTAGSPLSCTNCDLGLVNINNMCLSTNALAAPITYLKPNFKNILTDSPSGSLNCSVTSTATNSVAVMIFSPTIGSTFTRSFSIPYQHIFLQVKFNSIIAAIGSSPASPTLLLNVFTSSGKTIFSTVKSFTSGNPVKCSSNYQAANVFNVAEKFVSTDTEVLIEVRSSGATNANIALTDFELYYGNCSQKCEKCSGPTDQECLTCRGLLTTLTNSTCIGCAAGFYQNIICFPCPIECATCTFVNQVACLSCNPDIAFTVPNTTNVLGCHTNYSKHFSEIDQTFTSTTWKSSETQGNIVTTCGYYSLIGGISIGVAGSSLSNVYRGLPAHTTFYIYFNLFLIDQPLGDQYAYQISVDGVVQQINFPIESTLGTLTNECGTSSGLQYAQQQKFNFTHNSDTATVVITFLKDYAAIRDISIVVNNQTAVDNCYSQLNGECKSCRNGFQLVNNSCSSCGDGYYLQNNTCSICPITCKTCNITNTLISCLSCQNPLVLDGIYCVDVTQSLFTVDAMENITNYQTKTNWTLYPRLQDNGLDSCNGNAILGSSDIRFKFLSMKKTFTGLPAHTGVTVFFDFYQIDDYANDSSVKFILNSVPTIYQPSNLKMNLCGNISTDAVVPIYLIDTTHTASTLNFEVKIDRMGKIGINNIMIYLLNSQNTASPPYTIDSVPTYSVSTPPIKGMTVRLTFPQNFKNTTNTDNIFKFNAVPTQARLLQSANSNNGILVQNSSLYNNRQLYYLLGLSRDFINNQIQIRPPNPSNIFFSDPYGNNQLIPQQLLTSTVPRYVQMGLDNVNDRSSTRNLYNLFRGCAILALFIGMASFLFGMSAAFDDFLILCQVIFVHVFIQLDYNPPSVRIPFEGLHIVQFLEWLPWPARQGIQSLIIPSTLYQQSPLIYQQYYQDIVFARTIYQAVLYFVLLFVLWAILHILLTAWDSKHPKTKYSNYFLHFYHVYDSKTLAFVDKIVRFAYFTVVWACVLQCTHLSNQPKSFNIWNSILTILFFIAVFAYPIIMFFLLRRASTTHSHGTFNKNYEQIRISVERLFYYFIRYYKLIAIACVIGFMYSVTPIVPLIILIILNLADALLLIFTKPLGMTQIQHTDATVFYPLYPTIYHYTTIVQQFLFIILEIVFLILYGQRNNSSSGVYMGTGYAICVIVILLLLNGLLRLFWGFMKLAQQCYLQKQTFQQSVEKQIQENRDPAELNPIIDNLYKSQMNLSKRDLSRLQSKKLSYVSKIRA